MTAYLHRERRHWRYQLRRLAWRITLALSALALLLVLLPAVASAGSCPAGYIPISHGCRTPGGNSVACDDGYEGRFRNVNGRWVGRCAAGPIVWGGQP